MHPAHSRSRGSALARVGRETPEPDAVEENPLGPHERNTQKYPYGRTRMFARSPFFRCSTQFRTSWMDG